MSQAVMSHTVKMIVSSIVKVVCFLPVLFTVPRFLELAVTMPKTAYAESTGHTTLELVQIAGFVAAVWIGLVWTVYFGWRTIRTWANPSVIPALLMLLPTALLLVLVLVAMAGAG